MTYGSFTGLSASGLAARRSPGFGRVLSEIDPDRHTLITWIGLQSNERGTSAVLMTHPTEGAPVVWNGAASDIFVVGNNSWTPIAFNTSDNGLLAPSRSNTANLSVELARAYDAVPGPRAPLIIINGALSGQGTSDETTAAWNSDFEDASTVFKPAVEGEVIDGATSCYDLSRKALMRVIRKVEGDGRIPVLLFAYFGAIESNHTSDLTAAEHETGLNAIRDMIAGAAGTADVPVFVTKCVAENTTAYPPSALSIGHAAVDRFTAQNSLARFLDVTALGEAELFNPTENAGAGGVHYNWKVNRAISEKLIADTVLASNFGVRARVNNAPLDAPDVIVPLGATGYDILEGAAFTDQNLGTAFISGPVTTAQTAHIQGINVTISGDDGAANFDARSDGVMFTDASDDTLANGVSATPVAYTIAFAPPIKGLVIEARDFLLLSGRERRMSNFNIVPDSVTGDLDLTAGVVKGVSNGGDGTLVFPPTTEISELSFTVEGEGYNAFKGPRLRFLSGQAAAQSLSGVKISRNGDAEFLNAAGVSFTGGSFTPPFIPQVDDITALSPDEYDRAWQTGAGGAGAGLYYSIDNSGTRAWFKA